MDENIVDNNLPAPADPLLEKIKNVFFSEYDPVFEFKPGVIFMSTREVYTMFLNLYHNEMAFSSADVANWLHAKGFHFIKMKELEYQWMLMPSNLV